MSDKQFLSESEHMRALLSIVESKQQSQPLSETGMLSEDFEQFFTSIFEQAACRTDEAMIQTTPDQPYNVDPSDPESAYNEIMTFVDAVKNELRRGLVKIAGKEGKALVDIKQIESFKDKVLARGKNPNEITDVLRSALVMKDQDAVARAVKMMKKVFTIAEYDYKEFKGDKDFGYYGSHHFLVKLSNGLVAEVQLMTRRMWAYKHEAHKIYVDWRSKLGDFDKWDQATKKEFDAAKRKSKDIFRTGNKPPVLNKQKQR